MQKSYKVDELIYDGDIYDGMNTDTADLPFYSRWLAEKKDSNIMELCCGTGRLTIPLAKEGYRITGVDNSPSMLKQAAEKADRLNIPVTLIEADMRFFDLPETYDIIFIPFNSIHHLYDTEDFFRVLTQVKKHLKADGYFIFDCFNPDIRYIVNAENQEIPIAGYTIPDGREVAIKQTMIYENKTQINRIKWHYYINGTFDSVQNMDMRMFFPQELDAYLTMYGFQTLHKFGGFNEEPFEDNSAKQILVCKQTIRT